MTTNTNVARWHYALAKSELKVANVLKQGRSEAMTKLNKARAAWQRAVTGKRPAAVFTPDHDITIAGIPAGVVVTYYSKPRCNNWGHPDDRLPDDPAEVDFFIVDRKGYVADWLMDKEEYLKLRQRVIDLIEGERV